jgi:integrase
MHVNGTSPIPQTLADLLATVGDAGLPPRTIRDMKSAIKRFCEMAGCSPAAIECKPEVLRSVLGKIRPALHGVSDKTWANLRSLLVRALELAVVIDPMGRGTAKADPAWAPLMQSIARNTRMSCGLVAFANWCVREGISPEAVDDATVIKCLLWLETRTLCPKPTDVARRIPRLWNAASEQIAGWPKARLQTISFRPPPQRVRWDELPESFRRDTDAYLAMRADPDIFEDDHDAPVRPLAPATVRLQREQLHSAAAVLVKEGVAVSEIRLLVDLVAVGPFKAILRHFHMKADRKANAFLDSLTRTLVQVARFHLRLKGDDLAQLKRIARKLPPVPHDLTMKNKALLTQLESERPRAKLVFLPDELMRDVLLELKRGRIRFVWAQIAVAIDILLSAPLRCQNLGTLHWGRHFNEPDGPNGRLILQIPAAETKTRRMDYVADLPADVARRIRWYRKHIQIWLAADPNGLLFVAKGGRLKSQETLSQQITETIAARVGVHMTPHQFRHLAATLYLEDHPEDFETAKNLLGHASSKTTSIYAGSSSRRATRVYGKFLLEHRQALKLTRPPKRPRRQPQDNE